jgi:hypothetical protein
MTEQEVTVTLTIPQIAEAWRETCKAKTDVALYGPTFDRTYLRTLGRYQALRDLWRESGRPWSLLSEALDVVDGEFSP